jgi:hypothetical protein
MHLTLQLVLCEENGDLVNDVWTKPRRPSRVGPESKVVHQLDGNATSNEPERVLGVPCVSAWE